MVLVYWLYCAVIGGGIGERKRGGGEPAYGVQSGADDLLGRLLP